MEFKNEDVNSLAKYHLKNTHLDNYQKAIIEAFYQVPSGINEFIFILLLVIFGINDWVNFYIISGVVGILVSYIATKIMTKNISLKIFMFLSMPFAGNGRLIIHIILAIVNYYLTKSYLISVLAVLSGLGVTSVLFPGFQAIIFLNRGDAKQRKKKLHFKYVMANKIFNTKF